MAGSEKYPLHFVSKRTHLLHFSNTKSLPGTYNHIEAASVIWKVALNLWSLSLSLSHQTYDINEEDSTAFVDHCLTQPRLRKFAKYLSWDSFSANALWPVDQGIIWAAKRIPQGACSETAANTAVKWSFLQIVLAWCWTVLSIVWSSLTWETIADCSVTPGFSAHAVASGQYYGDDDDGDDNDDIDDDNNSVGDKQICDIYSASGKNKHQSHFWRVYLNCWYLSAFQMVDRG